MDWRAAVRETLCEMTGDGARDEEIVEEVADHLAQRCAELRAGGASEAEAARRTLAELREEEDLARRIRRADRPRHHDPIPPPTSEKTAVLHDLANDLRHGARLLRKTPGFAISAIATLALGIGATTAIFSVIDAVLLRPAPLRDPQHLMMIWETDRTSGTAREPSSFPDYQDFRQRSRQFAEFGYFSPVETNFTPNDGEPRRLAALGASPGFLATIGVRPLLGRSFTPQEDQPGAGSVALISERLWEGLFQRRRDVIGQTIRLDDRATTIVGVLPRDAAFGAMQILARAAYARSFADRDPRTEVDLWLPLQRDTSTLPRSGHGIFVVGRLASGATRATAQLEMAGIAADLERTYRENVGRGANVEPMEDVIFWRVKPALGVLLAAVSFVLLIACVNVANLLLARGTVRGREVAVRAALGASTRRLARQFAAENLVLTTIAAALGVALALGGLRALVALAPADIPRLADVAIDLRALGAALGVAVATGLVFGLVPVVQARRLDVQAALASEDSRTGTPGRQRGVARSGLVVAEIALASMLVIVSGLLIRSFWRLEHVDAGFNARDVLKAEFALPPSRYPANMKTWPSFTEMHRFNADLLRRVAALPGVQSAAIAGNHPLDAGFTNSFTIIGREAEARNWPEISVRRVTAEYFSTVQLALDRGRRFTESDGTLAPPVGVINEAAARRFFEGRDPLGAQIRFWGKARTIVGVVADERFQGLMLASPPAIYLPLAQAPSVDGNEALLVRASGPPASYEREIRTAIGETDRALAVFGLEPLENTVSESVGQRRFLMLLLVVFATLALSLAAVGIHGVLSYTVAQRRHEIGIRLALGATRRKVTWLVLSRGIRLTVMGIGLGVAGALLAARVLASLLFGISVTDAITMLVALPVLAGVALLAAYAPARHAVHLDPLAAMRDG